MTDDLQPAAPQDEPAGMKPKKPCLQPFTRYLIWVVLGGVLGHLLFNNIGAGVAIGIALAVANGAMGGSGSRSNSGGT